MTHTPYDGSHKPFTIGLAQLDHKEWIEVDDQLIPYLDEKRRLYHVERANVLVEEVDSRTAQQEVLDLLAAHVLERFPEHYERAGSTIRVGGQHSVDLASSALNPLAIAALLVQEDLVLMRKSPEGWRLVAASLCFPSAWNLREKFGKPLHEVHAPVPGFGKDTRNANLIERMFDNLNPERSVIRWNWSLYGDTKLYYPSSDYGMAKRFGSGDLNGNVILRLERQTLRKLPKSGDVLFTIRIHVDPLEVLQKMPTHVAHALADQIAALSNDEIKYKGFADERERLLSRLDEIADSSQGG